MSWSGDPLVKAAVALAPETMLRTLASAAAEDAPPFLTVRLSGGHVLEGDLITVGADRGSDVVVLADPETGRLGYALLSSVVAVELRNLKPFQDLLTGGWVPLPQAGEPVTRLALQREFAPAGEFRVNGFSYNIALNGGIALATLFRYWSYKRWVWPAASAASGRVRRRPVRRSAHGRLSRLPARELAKFGIVGTFAFLVTSGGSFLLHVWVGAGPLTSSAVAIATAMAVSYAGNRCWTFRHRQHIAIRRESIRYVTLQGAGLAVQLSCVALTAFVLGQHGKLSFEAALVIGTGLSAAIRFWSYREWVWPARRPVPAIQAAG